ncbi:MAG: hypothetical protein EOM07_12915 [Clostridia bacterium]|nr:hypothetical protein [Clostridia bacterium]
MNEQKKPMTRKEILETIEMLSRSQGFYGRLLRDLEIMRENDPYPYEAFMKELENEEFRDPVDMVLYFET